MQFTLLVNSSFVNCKDHFRFHSTVLKKEWLLVLQQLKHYHLCGSAMDEHVLYAHQSGLFQVTHILCLFMISNKSIKNGVAVTLPKLRCNSKPIIAKDYEQGRRVDR